MFTFISNNDGTCTVYFDRRCNESNVVIPEYSPDGDLVSRIGNNAFSRCSYIKSITIPTSVTSIGNSAFSCCFSLKSINIPDSVTEIGASAFHGCAHLFKEMSVKATNKNMECLDYQFSLGEWNHEDFAIMCKKGFHFVVNPFDVFEYYYGEIGKTVRFFEVEVDGVSGERDSTSKRVCTDIKLKREITSYSELLN